MTIPKIIWQTYKSKKVPPPAEACIRSWRQLNPNWHCEFVDDAGVAAFIRDNFSAETFEAFSALPVAVMKADFWRCAVLLKHGGVYADIDAICRVPIDEWPLEGKGMMVCTADRVHLGQWTVPAAAGHPVLQHAVDLMEERIRTGVDTSYEHFVHYYTGLMAFTDAVRTYLGADEDHVPLDRWNFPDTDRREMNGDRLYHSRHLWRDRDIIIVPQKVFDGQLVDHISGSSHWYNQPDFSYESWQIERTHQPGFPLGRRT